MKKIEIAPSFLSADFTAPAPQLRTLCDSGMRVLHLDIMDGHFVPNISFGPGMVKALRPVCPGVYFDVHLMLSHPLRYIPVFAAAGADMITVHAECEDDIGECIDAITAAGLTAGISIKPGTAPEAVAPYAGRIGLCLVMSVEPGFGGQSMIVPCIEKLPVLRDILGDDVLLSVDGGVDAGNCAFVAGKGADIIVAGSAVFGKPDIAAAFRELDGLVSR